MDKLVEKMRWTFDIFSSLDPAKKYQICFSGGKDSYLLAGIYLQWIEMMGGNLLDMSVVFSDTVLEVPLLYDSVRFVEASCNKKGVLFRRVSRPLDQDFWVLLFGRGYAVPSFIIRWCTKHLKINPIEAGNDFISLTGSHISESLDRDARLTKCGSLDCGVDLMTGNIEPIARWLTCDVWDWLGIYGDTYLGEGCFNKLDALYKISSEEQVNTRQGSLRLGCFCCPVITVNSLHEKIENGIVPAIALDVRNIIESLRAAPRLPSSRTGNDGRAVLGAIRVDERIEAWEKFLPFVSVLKEYGWISAEVIAEVERLLGARAYPKTYTKEWIAANESKARVAPWMLDGDRRDTEERKVLQFVHERQEGKCLECRTSGQKLKYHFINYDLTSVVADNVVMLCPSCHKKIAKAKGCDLCDIWEDAMKKRLVELQQVLIKDVTNLGDLE